MRVDLVLAVDLVQPLDVRHGGVEAQRQSLQSVALLDLHLQRVLVAPQAGVAVGSPGQWEQVLELVVVVGGTGEDVLHVVGVHVLQIVKLLSPAEESTGALIILFFWKGISRVGGDLRIASHCSSWLAWRGVLAQI
ncbi:hypothetical protein M5D96_010010 [Drosophila gunungcola]|uniref:Uncharacterized protein n=1 Tax=Drosophila gunungcola TaxID=103775 RepID=A0A9P9YIK9_9MUSC|nr:hypothetical protein M5D96_010010 [Drosophila gunungcola]